MRAEDTTCPLCGSRRHDGKCERKRRGHWWCGLCLKDKLAPSDLILAPPLPGWMLLEQGVQQTDKWCNCCGTPICGSHRLNRQTPRCSPNCYDRSPTDLELLRTALENYVPDYLTAGPVRCRLCGLPAHRRQLCQRHYEHVRTGRPNTDTGRIKRRRFLKRAVVFSYLTPRDKALAKHLADAAGLSLSEWFAEVLATKIEAELKVNPRLLGTVWGYRGVGK